MKVPRLVPAVLVLCSPIAVFAEADLRPPDVSVILRELDAIEQRQEQAMVTAKNAILS